MRDRLRKSRTDRVVFGVCGGLGEYFTLDSTLVRLAFVLLVIAGGSGILAYVVLALLMPPPSPTTREPPPPATSSPPDAGASQGMPPPPVPAASLRENHRGAMLIGGVLIAVGIIALFNNFNLFWWLNWGRLWPVILVVIGLALLAGRYRRSL